MIIAVIAVSSLISKKKNSKVQETQTESTAMPSAPVQESPAEHVEEVPVSAVMAETDESSESLTEPDAGAVEGSGPEVKND